MRLVSSRKPFGFDTLYKGKKEQKADDIVIYQNGGVGYLNTTNVLKNQDTINKWKVFIPRAGSGSDSFPHPILGKPFVGFPGSVCSETYIFIGGFDDEQTAKNVISYISTKLVRLLVLLHKPSQDTTQSVYTFVPLQDFTQSWSDTKLYEKYGLSKSDIAFIDKMIRPMDFDKKNTEVQDDE
jgi:site-specific DNA-methyltransferase (adenine-specific)